MNQDFFQNQSQEPAGSVFFDAPVKKNAKYYRTQARSKMKPVLGLIILVTFLASLLGSISGGIGFSFEFNISADSEEAANADSVAWANNLTVSDEELTLFAIIFVAFLTFVFLVLIAFSLFVSSPVMVGYRRFLLEVIDENTPEIRIQTLFRFFKEGYFKTVRLNLLHSLIMTATTLPLLASTVIGTVVFLNSVSPEDLLYPSVDTLLTPMLILGAIVTAGALISIAIILPVEYMYGFAHIIMADCPTVTALEALRASRTLMKGRKWKLFCLDVSFLGWYLLGGLLCGIGTILVTPYHYTARALFYHDIAQRNTAKDVEFPSIDPDEGEVAEQFSAPAQMPPQEESTDAPEGLSAESLESIEFPSLDLDKDD